MQSWNVVNITQIFWQDMEQTEKKKFIHIKSTNNQKHF